ncbi:MAG: hypothetical protein Hens3KO_24730 [Henriciella sp.]
MSREIDERKKRKALRKLRKAAMLAEQGLGPPLSDWEKQFLEEVEERIETYGSAFADPGKGGRDEPLSALQTIKLREIDKKARGKGKSGLKTRNPSKKDWKPSVRQIHEVEDETPPRPEKPAKPKLVKASEMPAPLAKPKPSDRPKSPPKLRVIKGGAENS